MQLFSKPGRRLGIERLNKLRKDGTLNEEEFARANNSLLGQQNESCPGDRSPRENSFGEAADRFVSMQVVVIGAVIILAVFWPCFCATGISSIISIHEPRKSLLIDRL
jgi:hypothetical protein